jgi:uncharacterized protein YkwD/Zn finger protein HypA/HybF involved in hydrogenase expression
MGAYCRACGYTFQESESKNVCPMCGSTKIRYSRNIALTTKLIGIGFFLAVVWVLLLSYMPTNDNEDVSEQKITIPEQSSLEPQLVTCSFDVNGEQSQIDCGKNGIFRFMTKDAPYPLEKFEPEKIELYKKINDYFIKIYMKDKELTTQFSYQEDKTVPMNVFIGVMTIMYQQINSREGGFFDEILQPEIQEQKELESETSNEIQIRDQEKSNPDDKELQTELEIHRLVNIERQKHGLKTLSYDDTLASIAGLHSEDMAQRKFFSHVNPDGDDPTTRGHKIGYNCRVVQGDGHWEGIGENIHMKSGSTITFWDSHESIAKETVDGWMNSEGHRKNILTNHYQREGIGVEITNFEIYVTQNFC